MDSSARTSFLVRSMHMQLAGLIEQELKKLSLTNGQYTVLSTIARRSGSSSAEIARRLRVKPQALNEFIPPFEQRGLIMRRGHPDNRRILCVFLTPEGQQLLKLCDEAVDRLEEELFAGLSHEELSTFRNTTAKIVDAMSSFDSAGDRSEDEPEQRQRAEPIRVARGFD
ncbi:MAG: MarR family transcriptional regulator [Alphaproteobacteria bacterium]